MRVAPWNCVSTTADDEGDNSTWKKSIGAVWVDGGWPELDLGGGAGLKRNPRRN
jgi:hypothetical protein